MTILKDTHMQFLIAYAITAVIFLVIDLIWIGVIAKDFYFSSLAGMMKEKPNMAIALGFYLLYVVGIVFFCVQPALANGAWTTALFNGALLGLIAYATYDLTNLAIMKDWPVKMAIVDMIWGTAVTGFTATAGYFVIKLIGLPGSA